MIYKMVYKIKNYVKYNIISRFDWLEIYFSPFIKPKVKFYIGKIKYGTPYFFPRRWVKFNKKDCYEAALKDTQNKHHIYFGKNPSELIDKYKEYNKAAPKTIGFDFVSLGWKTKWRDDDIRFEWNPIWSFVFFKWQIVLTFYSEVYGDVYWCPFIYYKKYTSGTKEERIKKCIENYHVTWTSYNRNTNIKTTTNYYNLILKKKYLKFVNNEDENE